jgi:predicted MFS family arabinose efflux permease
VFAEALHVSIAGLAAGTALALIGGRLVGVFISDLPGWDITTLGAPPTLLALIVAGAAVLPLRRALRVSAATALRAE